jgi:hypothetical protein
MTDPLPRVARWTKLNRIADGLFDDEPDADVKAALKEAGASDDEVEMVGQDPREDTEGVKTHDSISRQVPRTYR